MSRKGQGLSPIRPETFGERLIPESPGFARSLAVTALLLAAASLLRLATMQLAGPMFPAAPFFPAVTLAAVYGGWRWGLAAGVVSAAIVWAFLASAGVDPRVTQGVGLGLYSLSCAVCVVIASTLRGAVLRLRALMDTHVQAERALREGEARFRALADSAPALMWISRLGGQREFVSRAYAEFAGGTYDEALNLDWRERLHPEDLPRILQAQVAGEASRQSFSLEGRYGRADGEWRWLRSYSQPRHGPTGEFLGFIGIAFDVTEAKRVEEDLTRINDLLAERIEAALAERDEAQAALIQAQKLEALGQLTGGVAHDFNNLLTVVIGALDILQRHPDDPARVAKLSAAALGAAQRGERLTQQLLAFSRRQPLRPEVVGVDALLAESATLYRRALGEAPFTLALEAGEACAQLDAAQFEAALLNLLVNARDAVAGGGGGVRLHTAQITRREARGDVAPGDYVCIAVTDEGVGMDPAVLARVFEPFFTTKPVGKGTGLGLSQVYGFARQTGGDVEIESAPGQGTTVRMLLPLSRAAARAPAPPAAAPAARPSPMTVLLVEDDQVVGDTVEAMLAELGHSVLRADTADAALAVAAAEPRIGLVLSDVIMPGGKTGVDLGIALTRARPGLPVVLSSGYTGEALAEAEAAPWPLLRKPYSVDALAAAIAHACEHPAGKL